MTIAKVTVMTSKTTAATILRTLGPEKRGEYRASRKLRQEKMQKVRRVIVFGGRTSLFCSAAAPAAWLGRSTPGKAFRIP
jgi:hypothetical protein